jgi:hypothetical protein
LIVGVSGYFLAAVKCRLDFIVSKIFVQDEAIAGASSQVASFGSKVNPLTPSRHKLSIFSAPGEYLRAAWQSQATTVVQDYFLAPEISTSGEFHC